MRCVSTTVNLTKGILMGIMSVGCGSHGESKMESNSKKTEQHELVVSRLPLQHYSDEVLLQRAVQEYWDGPSLGHLNEYELELATRGTRILPSVLEMMTSKDGMEREVSLHLLREISMNAFKSSANNSGAHASEKGLIEGKWVALWQKNGCYTPGIQDSTPEDKEASQTLVSSP